MCTVRKKTNVDLPGRLKWLVRSLLPVFLAFSLFLPSDVVAGAALGYLIGRTVVKVTDRRANSKKTTISPFIGEETTGGTCATGVFPDNRHVRASRWARRGSLFRC